MGTQEDHLTELSDAARRAGSIVNEYIDSIVDAAERQAAEIRQAADREADETRQAAERAAELARQEALNSAQRVFERINALEQPIGELVETLRMEMERVGRELESVVDAEAIGIAAESEDAREQGSAMPGPSSSEAPGRAREPTWSGREPESEVVPPFEPELTEEPSVEALWPADAEAPALEDLAPVDEGTLVEDLAPVDERTLVEDPAATDDEPALRHPVPVDEAPLADDSAPAADDEPGLRDPVPIDDEPVVKDPVPLAGERAPAAYRETTAEPVMAEPLEDEIARVAPEPEPASPSEPDAAPERDAAPEAGAASSPSSLEAERKNEPAAAEQKERVMFAPEPAPEEKPRSKFRSVFNRGGSKGVFITSQGHCSVCQRTFMAGTEENLRLSGWRVNGDVGLCPECQVGGWQLPDGARLPFRRGGA